MKDVEGIKIQKTQLRRQSRYLSFNLDYLDASYDPICHKTTQVNQ